MSGGPVLSVWGLGVMNFTTPAVQVPLPPTDPGFPLVVTAPFEFDARIHLFGEPGTVPVFAGDLVGAGIARALLVGSGSTWSFAQLEYAFTDQTPVPEPGTMLLVLGGLAALMRKRAACSSPYPSDNSRQRHGTAYSHRRSDRVLQDHAGQRDGGPAQMG